MTKRSNPMFITFKIMLNSVRKAMALNGRNSAPIDAQAGHWAIKSPVIEAM